MQITIDIPDRAVVEAAELGKTVQDYAAGLLQLGHDQLARERGWGSSGEPEDFIRRMSRFSVQGAVLPAEAFSRSSIYSDDE